MSRRVPWQVLLAAWCATALLAAQYRGAINEEVLDASGAAVPNARIKVKAAAVGIEREAASNEEGFFTVPNLPAADYELSVEAAGFKSFVRSGIRLDSDAAVTLKVQLEVGALSERIEVTAEAPSVEVSHGEVSRLITGSQMQNFALAGRNPYYMLGIVPGVVSRYGNFLSDFRATSYSMGGLQINGQRKDTNFMTLDGVNNSRVRDGVQVNNIVGVDFIEEVKVLTTHYAPEYGRTTGAQINFITRRGTREFHGSLYEFFLSDQFAARRYIVGDKPRVRYHNYGGTLGGPIYVPGKFNTEKSKLFFFVGVERRYLAGVNAKISTVPATQERRGDFSASRLKPLDPDTKAPFPADLIPASRIGNLGGALQKIYPDPNYTGPGGNYFATRDQPTESQDVLYRVDYNIRPNWQLTVRSLIGSQDFTSWFDNTGNNIPLFQVNRDRRGNNHHVGLQTAFGPATVNEFGVGYSDYREDFRVLGAGARRQTWGINVPEIYPGNRNDRIPAVAVSGYTGISGSGHPSYARTPTFILRDNFTRVMGGHVFKAGFYWESMNMNELNQANDNGSFSFGNTAANPRNSGNSWANALLGNFDGYSESSAPVQTIYKAYSREFYAQDNWRAHRRLTVEYGLRYSLISPWYARWNNLVAFMEKFWDPAKAPQVAANGVIVPESGDVYNGLVMPGPGFPKAAQGRIPEANDPAVTRLFRGIPRAFHPLRKTNFQPRLSLAWDVFGDGRTALRAGAGIFHGVTGIAYSGWYLGARPPLVKSATVTNGHADNPGSGIPVTAQFPIAPGALPEQYEIPTVYIYSFGVQRQFPWQMLLEAGYVGNAGRHLSFSRPFNFITPEVFAANLGRDLRPFLPYRGLDAFNIVEPAVTSSYNSLQVAARKRSGQFTYSLAYTLGKIIGFGNEGVAGGVQDPRNVRAERSELEESRRHNLVLTHTWELPWHRAQRGLLGRLAGGWSISGVWTANTGRLFGPGLTAAPRQVATRPDVVGDWRLPESERTLFRWFRTEAFARPKDFTYGNCGKWVVRGPGTIDLGAFALKSVRIREGLNAQLRVEAFNAMNHMNLDGVNTTLGHAAFGQINSVGSQRYLQLGAKLQW